jgi:hypothetical protein
MSSQPFVLTLDTIYEVDEHLVHEVDESIVVDNDDITVDISVTSGESSSPETASPRELMSPESDSDSESSTSPYIEPRTVKKFFQTYEQSYLPPYVQTYEPVYLQTHEPAYVPTYEPVCVKLDETYLSSCFSYSDLI